MNNQDTELDYKEVALVVVKGDSVFAIPPSRKLVREFDLKAILITSASNDFRALKKMFPHATLRDYNDTRLSNYYRGSVDRAQLN